MEQDIAEQAPGGGAATEKDGTCKAVWLSNAGPENVDPENAGPENADPELFARRKLAR